MNRCLICGYLLEGTEENCPRCGWEVTPSPAQSREAWRKRREKEILNAVIVLVCAVIALVLIALAWLNVNWFKDGQEAAAAVAEIKAVQPKTPEEVLTQIEEVAEVEQEEEDDFTPFAAVDLPEDLQRLTVEVCEENGVPCEVAFGIMFAESTFRADAQNGRCYGLMQVSDIHFPWLEAELGISDLLDAEDNIKSGVFLFGNLLKKYGDVNKALMAYNHGQNGAKKLWDKGTFSTKYTEKVIGFAEKVVKDGNL